MAIINNYPLTLTLAADDLFVVSSGSNNSVTKSVEYSVLKAAIAPTATAYTSLVQLLTQTGTNAPVATEVYNNTGETFTWSYVSDGVYRITSTGASFTLNKTVVFVNHGNANTLITSAIMWQRVSDTVLEIIPGGDGRIVSGSFEVKIYN